MKPSYYQALADDLGQCLDGTNIFTVHRRNEVDKTEKQWKSSNTTKPAVICQGGIYRYLKDGSTSHYDVADDNGVIEKCDFDYFDTMPAVLNSIIHVMASDIATLSSLEESITSRYQSGRTLEIKHPVLQDKKIPFTISLYSDGKITREKKTYKNKELYFSKITLVSDTCVSFFEKYSAAQLDLDPQAVVEAVERAGALEDYKALLSEQDGNDKSAIIEQISKVWSELDGLLGYSGIATYHKINEITESRGCSVPQALDYIKEEIAAEKENAEKEAKRLEDVDKLFGSVGDKILNRYTDAVVEDIRSKMKDLTPVAVYGGSTYLEVFRLLERNALPFPSLVVCAYLDYFLDFDCKKYINLDKSGNSIEHDYTEKALPIYYVTKIVIQSLDESEANAIAEQLEKIYETEVCISVSDPVIAGEFIPVRVLLDKDEQGAGTTQNDTFCGRCYQKVLTFKSFHSVYYHDLPSSEDIQDNQVLQLHLLKQAEFMMLVENSIRDALSKLKNYYKPLFDGSLYQPKSFFGSAFDKVFSFLDSEEYKRLKMNIKNRLPFDKALFDAALRDVVNVYPSLYDKTMQGMSFEQINADLSRYADYFNENWSNICKNVALCSGNLQLINLIGMTGHENKPSDRIQKGLRFFITEMRASPYATIAELIPKYKRKLAFEKEQEEQERYAQSNSSASHGLLSTLAHRAYENSNIKGNAGKVGKRDLIGQAGCAKNYGGNCSNCNIRLGCSRYFF